MSGTINSWAKSSSRGFTLIEVSALLVVCSLLLVAGISLIKTWMDKNTLAINQQRLVSIRQAIANYEALNGELPCPARYTDAQSSAQFGREWVKANPRKIPNNCRQNSGTFSGAPVSPTLVIGAVPVRDLGLPDSYIADTYGYRFTYATTQAGATAPMDPSLTNTIKVTNYNAPPIPTTTSMVTYVVVDHGPTGKGTYTIDGKASTGCPATASTFDSYNCNKYASGYFETAPFNNYPLAGASWFDDSVIASTPPAGSQSCIVTSASSAPGNSGGTSYFGYDSGFGSGFGICWIVGCFSWGGYSDELYFGELQNPGWNTSSPPADARCTPNYPNVVTGGCTQTSGGSPYGGDISGGSGIQPIMLSSSHPIFSAGTQGWECNGSSASGIQTTAYALCCSKGN